MSRNTFIAVTILFIVTVVFEIQSPQFRGINLFLQGVLLGKLVTQFQAADFSKRMFSILKGYIIVFVAMLACISCFNDAFLTGLVKSPFFPIILSLAMAGLLFADYLNKREIIGKAPISQLS